MKKKRLLILPILSICTLLFCGVFSSSNLLKEESYVCALASSSEVEAFEATYLEVRTAQPEVCNTSKEDCDKLVNAYKLLTKDEQKTINQEPDVIDPKYTKGEVMTEIIRLYSKSNKGDSSSKTKLNQSTTIIIAVVVSLFGMSAISVLYILKNNKYIE